MAPQKKGILDRGSSKCKTLEVETCYTYWRKTPHTYWRHVRLEGRVQGGGGGGGGIGEELGEMAEDHSSKGFVGFYSG